MVFKLLRDICIPGGTGDLPLIPQNLPPQTFVVVKGHGTKLALGRVLET